MTKKSSPSASLSSLSSARLRLIASDSGTLGDEVDVASLWSSAPLLILAVRRPVSCNEQASEVWQQKEVLQKMGVNVVAVIKENITNDVPEFREYFGGDVYLDEQMGIFKALTGDKLVRHGTLATLLQFKSLTGIGRVLKKGIKSGSMAGDASIYGGILVVTKDGVHYQHNEKVGYLPPTKDLMDACARVSPLGEEKARALLTESDVKVSEVKHGVCTNDGVCLRQ